MKQPEVGDVAQALEVGLQDGYGPLEGMPASNDMSETCRQV